LIFPEFCGDELPSDFTTAFHRSPAQQDDVERVAFGREADVFAAELLFILVKIAGLFLSSGMVDGPSP